ncbi:hypothetical protein STRTUCAR8_01730 [Streptomyces turgidiscabies Car8]|uniref:Uncharacterized protein n=1 Tax=Streptomyces turgidiscabies (strain Car8) TaxID=698760 RepID=L7F4N3_STRT8|nr:hypothetical protein STRTUCAR8_01730 [Streptomyces turgidiscabies Car8]
MANAQSARACLGRGITYQRGESLGGGHAEGRDAGWSS